MLKKMWPKATQINPYYKHIYRYYRENIGIVCRGISHENSIYVLEQDECLKRLNAPILGRFIDCGIRLNLKLK